MNDFQSILLTTGGVIVTVLFVVFLLIGIAVVFMLFKIMSNIRRVTARIDETTEDAGAVVKYMGTKIGPSAASAIGSILLRRAKSNFKRKK